MEAGWLAALALAPLFFNTYSSRTFEPDKIALVRSIALIIVAAWSVKIIEEGGLQSETIPYTPRRRTQFLSQLPLFWPVVGLIVAYLISTLLSLTPRISFWGSYTRLQGTYTFLSYVVIFAAIAVNVRRKEQVERLVNTIIFTSLPVSLYGIMQRLGIDPLPWGEDTSNRVTSTLGNAIFIAAYLIMIAPLTAMRIAQSFRAVLRDDEGLARNVTSATAFTFVGAMQLLAIWFSGSRGPWLGLLAGLFFWAMLMSLAFKQRPATLSILGAAGGVAIFLIVLNIPNGPLEPLRRTAPLGRLGRVFELQDDTSQVRVLIWEGVVQMMSPHDPITFPDGHPDPVNPLRLLVGYGPETMVVAYNRFYPPGLGQLENRTATPDRSHNETFDALGTTGLIGLIAYLVLFAAVIYYGLKWLGLITPQDKWLYAGLYFGGGVLGAAALVAWRGPAYFGVGLPFGMLIGLLAYLTFLTLNRTVPEGDSWKMMVLPALLGGVVAHFTEIHFGIAIAATRLHFWAFAGLLVAIGWARPEKNIPATESARTKAAETGVRRKVVKPRSLESSPTVNRFAEFFPALIVGLILITMSYNFVGNADKADSVIGMLAMSFSTLYGRSGAVSLGMALLFLIVWLIGTALWSEERRSALMTLGGSAAIWLVFTFYYAISLRAVATRSPSDIFEMINTVELLGGVLTGFVTWVMALMAVAAVCIAPAWPKTWFGSRGGRFATPALLAAAIVLGYFTDTQVVQADMSLKVAGPWEQQSRWDVVIPLYQHAIKLAPDEDQYYLYLARAYLSAANASKNRVEQETILNVALGELRRAQALNPLNPDHSANQARLLQSWSRTTTDPNEARVRIDDANGFFATALSLSPNNASLWNEWARFDFTTRKDMAGAQSKLAVSLKLDDQFNETYLTLGDLWAQVASTTGDGKEQQDAYAQAAGYYQQAITAEANKRGTPPSLTARLGLATMQQKLERWDEAIGAYDDVIKVAGDGYNVWTVYNALAEIYLAKGDKTTALDYADKALAEAPEGDKVAVQALIEKIGK